MQYVYILKCANNKTYVGCTSNLKSRLDRHNNGRVTATASLLPVKLVLYISFNNKFKAYDFEKYLKSGSGRAFMNKRFL